MNTSTLPEPTTTPASHSAPAPPPAAGRAEGASAAALIEFPRPGRAKPPQWRKELSERVREIQQRRALEAARDAEDAASRPPDSGGPDGLTAGDGAAEAPAPQLGLVPPPPEPAELNPLVAKALERIERARRQAPPPPQQPYAQQARAASAPAPAAAARLPEEGRQPAPPPTSQAAPAPQPAHANAAEAFADEAAPVEAATAEAVEQTSEPARTTTLVVVPSPPQPAPTQSDTDADAAIREALSRPRPRRHIPEVADDALILRREAEVTPHVHEEELPHGERAPLPRRFAAGLVDLLVVAFASSPFAAIIELTSGNWHDPRVAACLGGIVLTIMFLYATISVAFSGRTWGMGLFSLRAVDARSGLIPTAGQCARRALFHMLSLGALGLGLLPALFDRQGRAAHDHLSRTVVVTQTGDE